MNSELCARKNLPGWTEEIHENLLSAQHKYPVCVFFYVILSLGTDY
jgi:hypothetical protein